MSITMKSYPETNEKIQGLVQLSHDQSNKHPALSQPVELTDGGLQPLQTPKDDAEVVIPPTQVGDEALENDDIQPTPASTPEDKKTTNVEDDGDGLHPAHLHCPVTRTTHANLLEFEIFSCPLCLEDLRSKPTKRSKPESSEPDESNSSVLQDEIKDAPKPHSAVEYKIKFEDAGGYVAAIQEWHEPLNLETARTIKNSTAGRSVLEVVSVVRSDIQRDSSRYESEKAALLREGILDNPKYTLVPTTTEIYIHSWQVIQALRQLVAYYPGISLMSNSIHLVEPYCFLFHILDDLLVFQETCTSSETIGPDKQPLFRTALAAARCDKETSDHINVIHDFLKAHYVQKVEEEKARWKRSIAVATYEMLWLLFKPGVTVYTEIDGSKAACVVHSVTVDHTHIRRRAPYLLDLWHLDYDGRHLGRVRKSVFIHAFDGEIEITSLNVIPCEFYDRTDHGKLRARLEELGERFYSLLSNEQMHYSGESLGRPTRWIEGRVIIDSSTYYNFEKSTPPDLADIRDSGEATSIEDRGEKRCFCPECTEKAMKREQETGRPASPWELYEHIDPKVTKSLEKIDPVSGKVDKHRYLLCPKRVWGFVLKSRKWEKLSIEHCRESPINTKAIDTLKMPPERKTTIKALVHRFTKPSIPGGKNEAITWRADFIENKGEGQIFLLHGGPGVGKTYTAECIAEHTNRPLLSLTCSDIGTDEKNIEDQLSKWFRLAETWNAIMLIDEADIFLEKRATSDLQRNSLVSVFLRTMEYYRGILFLTTNRVGSFDDAFLSRIHAVIHYQNLSNEYRTQIWTQFFDKLRLERKDMRISEKAQRYVLNSKEMREVPWNGREIRNAFQTAVALAEYRFSEETDKEEGDRARLEPDDFEKVYEMTRDFKDYMDSISGADESGRARQARERNDAYELTKEDAGKEDAGK